MICCHGKESSSSTISRRSLSSLFCHKMFIPLVLSLLTLVSAELVDVLASHDLYERFSVQEFVGDGASSKVYLAIYHDGSATSKGSQKVAMKRVSRDQGRDRKTEYEINTLTALKNC